MFKRQADQKAADNGPSLGLFLNSIQTPAPVLKTFIGNPLFTTPDALDEITDAYLGQLDVADLVFKDFGDIPVSRLYTQFFQVKHMLSGRQSGKKSESNCDASGMSIDTNCGRKHLTVPTFVERIKVDQPKVVIALADEVAPPFCFFVLSHCKN